MNSNRLAHASAQFVFEQCCQSSKLLGQKQLHWVSRTQYYIDHLTPSVTQRIFPRIILSQTNSIEFLAGFVAACITQCPIFLGNPNWSLKEWQQALDLSQPHQIWGIVPIPTQLAPQQSAKENQKGWIMIPTGGSSGQIKFAIHTWNTLINSVKGFQQFFEVESVHSCCVLPLYHVSGLMQFMRSLLTQGQFVTLPFADLISGDAIQAEKLAFLAHDRINPQNFFLSLVPTQLQRLLQQTQHIQWLQQFSTILLGGSPPWPTLLEQAKQCRLNLAPTYGMTETAAQVATLTPHKFWQGDISTGVILPHVQLQIVDESGKQVQTNQTGQIHLQATSLFKGYYPNHVAINTLITDDRGYLDDRGHLFVVARSSRKILSGGENIFPEEVEGALLSTGLVKEVYVTSMSDEQWGEAVTALYVPLNSDITPKMLKVALETQLSRFKHPKYWIAVDELPRNPQGKLNQAQLNQIALQYLSTQYP